MTVIAIYVGLVFLYSLVSERLARTILTAPILFTCAGIATACVLPAMRPGMQHDEASLAGLGQIIVNSPRAPARIRQALNVEAGLNDGLSVPFLLFFMALAGASGASGGDGSRASLLRFIGEQPGLAR
jgi:hypothetical protein